VDKLEAIHSKFKDEQQCKNSRCAGYFLDKEPQNYCPACRRKGYDKGPVEENTDIIFEEVNMTKLKERVDGIDERLQLIEKRFNKKKTFKPKKCVNCENEFNPTSPNQQLCTECRDRLIK